jgi:hypothetical protein
VTKKEEITSCPDCGNQWMWWNIGYRMKRSGGGFKLESFRDQSCNCQENVPLNQPPDEESYRLSIGKKEKEGN